MSKLSLVLALMALVAGACAPQSTAAIASPTPSSHPSPTASAASPVQLCFKAPPADWAAAMSKKVATLKGINFGPGAVDDARGIAYGGFSSAHGQGIAAVNLATGKMSVVSLMSQSESGFASMSYADGWLVWAQGEARSALGIWSIQAWNTQTHEKRQLATSRLADGTYLTGQLVYPVVGHGYVAWNQPVSNTSADVRVYRFATRTMTTLDSGYVSSPVFAGSYLVWGKTEAAPDSPAQFLFADATTLASVSGPPELSRPYPATYLAGSPDYMLWIALPQTLTPSNSAMSVDELATGRVTEYGAQDHYLQLPTLAGPYFVWFGGDRNSVVDLRTASGFDIALPGGVSAVGDTIVVATIASLNKSAPSSTSISVVHLSRLSRLAQCGN
jgi:hypothetical protein